MTTQKFMGRHMLIDRLAAQVGDKNKALSILFKRGHVDKYGNLTSAGKARDQMTAAERALSRAQKGTSLPASAFKYDPRKNRAVKR